MKTPRWNEDFWCGWPGSCAYQQGEISVHASVTPISICSRPSLLTAFFRSAHFFCCTSVPGGLAASMLPVFGTKCFSAASLGTFAASQPLTHVHSLFGASFNPGLICRHPPFFFFPPCERWTVCPSGFIQAVQSSCCISESVFILRSVSINVVIPSNFCSLSFTEESYENRDWELLL